MIWNGLKKFNLKKGWLRRFLERLASANKKYMERVCRN